MVECEIKGKKVDDWQPQVSCHLKNSTKMVFLGTESPKTKECYILPPVVLPHFFLVAKSRFGPLRE